MAQIRDIEPKEPARTSVHEAVEATYHIFEKDGETFLQIDTYGSSDRKVAGKISQSVQFGQAGQAAIRAILDKLK